MEFLIPAVISFLITVFAIPPTIKLAKKYKLIDNPKLRPHPAHTQNRTVPRAGGLAVFIGLFATILIFIPLDNTTLGILVGLTILLFIGLSDDKYQNLSPYLCRF